MQQLLLLAGESYAGHYVPAVSHRIYEYNKLVSPDERINLKGLAVGNGMFHPAIQYGSYADYALWRGLIGQWAHFGIKSVSPVPDLAGLALVKHLDPHASCRFTKFS